MNAGPRIPTLVNGRESYTIDTQDRGLSYGDGIFETIAVHNGVPLLWDLHWQRLVHSCARLSLKLPDKELLEKETFSQAKKITGQGLVKIILTRGIGRRGYKPDLLQEGTRIISATCFAENINASKEVDVFICKYIIYPDPQLAGIKHLNRLPQVMASIEQNVDNEMGLLCDNKDNLVEAIAANIFIVTDGVLRTPDLSEYGVNGVMREHIIKQAKKLNIQIKIEKLQRSCLKNAAEVFLTNSIIGILPVRKFLDARFDSGFNGNSITRKLMGAIGQEKYYH